MLVLYCTNLAIFLNILNIVYGDDDILNHNGWEKLEQARDNMQCGRIQTPPNGDANSRGQFPWMAKLIRLATRVDDGKKYLVYHCAGSLVSNRFVVTSASCLRYMSLHHIELGTSDIKVNLRYGILQRLYRMNPKIHYYPEDEMALPDSILQAPKNDFAWIRLHTTVKFTDDIYPICLPREDKSDTMSAFTIAGWSIGGASEDKRILKKTEVTSMFTVNCKAMQPSANLDSNNMCADGFEATECNKEGGGPLMRVDKFNGQKYYFLYGVARMPTDDDCNPSRLFTNVYKFLINILNSAVA